MPSLPDLRFADARGAVLDALTGFLPADRVSVADHAAAHRWLDNRGGGFVGQWSHAEAPYLREPMEALTSRDHLTVAVVGPGRCGKTAIAENWLLQSVETDPADMLWYEPTDDAVESYVKRVIAPMIDLHGGLRNRLGANSLHFKRFGAMAAEFLAANYVNLLGKSAPRIVIDEVDACPDRLGDVYQLADVRRQTYGQDSMVLAVSHPDRATGTDPAAWHAGIMRLYAQSDRRAWWWPCPDCNGWSSPCPNAARVMTLSYPADAPIDEIAEATRLLCPICGALIEDRWRRPMNQEGVWIGTGQEIDQDGVITGTLARRDTAGFWIVGAMSLFILGGIGALARERVAAEREAQATGDEQGLRDVMAKRWGIPAPARRRIGALDAEAIADRAEADLVLGTVPDGVRFLTAAIDIQANRFEVLVRGWGVRGESWVVDAIRRAAEPSTDPEAWDTLLADLMARAWPLGDESGRGMRLRALGYDSGGEAGVTLQAYDAWRRARARGAARMLGRVAGRDAWALLPLKGLGGPNAARLSVVYPDSARKDRRAGARGQIPLGQYNANTFKDDLATQLARIEPGPWAVHVPASLRAAAPPHAWFEQLCAESRRADGRWEKRPGARNEAMDLMVMTHVLAHLHGIARIDWDRAPAWAAPWDRNPAVVALDAPAPAAPKGARTAPAPGITAPAAYNPAARRIGSADRLQRLVAKLA